jgi:deoxyribodipyrimidine photo-lyase
MDRRGEISQAFPQQRIRFSNGRKINPAGECVLYWMTAFRRLDWNFSLDRAVAWALELKKPLVIVESLPVWLPWSSRRMAAFIVQGMVEKRQQLQCRGERACGDSVSYLPVIEHELGQVPTLVCRLAGRLACVVTDDYPLRAWQRQVRLLLDQCPVRAEAVDSCGIIPLAAAPKIFARAYDFRRFWQQRLRELIAVRPRREPFRGLNSLGAISQDLLAIWQELVVPLEERGAPSALLDRLHFDREVSPVETPGGTEPARRRLAEFLAGRLERYAEDRNHPDLEATSGLSPYLHHGMISSQEVFWAVAEMEQWDLDRCRSKPTGSKGFLGMGSGAEEFLDQLLTWREIGYNFAAFSEDYDRFESLPDWAQQTLRKQADQPRPYTYTLEQLESAATHDPIWNAGQRELCQTGCMHNYVRMLWGKKILEWNRSPEEALQIMIELNNKYGLDAEDPNSYSGIFWILGRYDRPWGPERPIFGKVRYMSTESAARKLRLTAYVRKFAPDTGANFFGKIL